MALNLWKHSYEPGTFKTVYTLEENQYAGRVLKISRGESYQIMSDVWGSADWATVLDEENKPKRILMNIYDMGAPEHVSTGEVDATEEVKALYRQYYVDLKVMERIGTAHEEAKRIVKGCIAKVVRGRNAVGTQGKVVVVMSKPYNMGYRSSMQEKLGIATSDETFKKALPNGKVVDAHKDMVWVWAKNCQRVDIAPVDEEAIRAEVNAMATERVTPNW